MGAAFLSSWPWDNLGFFKYVLYGPLVGKALAARAWEPASPDHWLCLLLALFALRAFTYQLWSSYSNMLFLTRRRRIVRDGVDFEQIDKEWDWDNFLMLQILMAATALYAFPSLRHLPGWNTGGFAVAALLHVAATEPLFYAAHRAFHGAHLFARYHALHHSNKVPTPFTAGFATPLEHMVLGALMALPLAGACAAGLGSVGLAFAYVLAFDFLRAMGHCNVELFPGGLFRSFPFLRYLIYTPTMVWLLDNEYDTQHRSYMMREKGMKLEPLKIRYHGVSGAAMPYDERYTPYIQQAGLLPWIQLVSRSTPNLNGPLVSSLADRWRPETHSFHLRTGEMTVTLQDVSLITGLPIDGRPLCMSTDSDGWRAQMTALIGMAPTQAEAEAEADAEEGQQKKKTERKAAGAPFTWIQANFAHCPADATDDVVQTHARVYMWYVVSRTLFPDAGGKNAPWMWLKALTVFESRWSWGSAALAYLYRQLDEACCRISPKACISGNLLLLTVWSWERLPVGRPKNVAFNTWDEDDPSRLPTWAYKWDVVSDEIHDVDVMYQKYIAELDTITAEQVEWQPYGANDALGVTPEFVLNPMCLRDRDLWLMRCPLICNWAVEFHLPHRVSRQFGLFQTHPPEWKNTDKALHRLDRRKQRKIKDWDKQHHSYVTEFLLSVEQARASAHVHRREHDPLAFDNYLRWFQENTRVEVCPPAYNEDILEDPANFEDLSKLPYNKNVREGVRVPGVPMINYVRNEIKKAADESQSILEKTPVGQRNEEGPLRKFLKEQAKKLRRLSNILGCRDPEYDEPSASRSGTPSDPASHHDGDDVTSSAAYQDDEGAITQEVNDLDDDMTLADAQVRSAYMFKPRQPINRFSPFDFDNRGNPKVVVGSSRMASLDDEVDEAQEEEEAPPSPPKRKKIATRRGGKSTRARK